MAYQCINIPRKKCIPKGSQFGLWMRSLVIQCLISIPAVLSTCHGEQNTTLTVYPEKTVPVLYGSSLVLYCVANTDAAEDLRFTLAGKTLPSVAVNSSTRMLQKSDLQKGIYYIYCQNQKTKNKCVGLAVVDSIPNKVTDFACISKNVEVLNCTWTTLKQSAIMNHSLHFLINGIPVNNCNISHSEGDKIISHYCSWDTESKPRYRQMEVNFYFRLRSCNVFQCIEQNFTIDHFAVVKPKPPKELSASSIESHSVLLQWKIPPEMTDFLPPTGVDHRIEYQIAKIDNRSHFRSVDTSSLPRQNKTYSFKLMLPYAHMKYDVRIYIKTKQAVKDEFWSDNTHVIFETASERPKRPPATVAGAFDQGPYDAIRVIYVYWKQLEEYEEAGANFTYRVVTKQNNKSHTIYPDKNKSLSYVILEDATFDSIDVFIWSSNDQGLSENSSYLYIPPKKDTESLTVSSFTKLAYENGTYELSWVFDKTKKIDNYTLFWCQHNSSKICTGHMYFTVLDARKTRHLINLPRDNRYQFAISANYGNRTSGMVWANCDISKDGIAIYGFPVKLDHGAPRKTDVKITWTMTCTLQEGIYKGYVLTYCPVLDTSTVCDTTAENKTDVKNLTISDPKQMETVITNLKPYRTYQFELSLNTIHGLKAFQNASTSLTTLEDTPTNPRNVHVTNIQSNSVNISWDPPLHKNGVIRKYAIFNGDQKYQEDIVADNDKDIKRRYLVLTGLKGFTNYTWSVQACNTGIVSCSERIPKHGIFIRTRIGQPSQLKPPALKNPDSLKWEPPAEPEGIVDLYQVKRIIDDNTEVELFNTTELMYTVIQCEGSATHEQYQVRAVNFVADQYYGILRDSDEADLPETLNNYTEYAGDWSEPITVACGSRERLTLTLIIIVVFALAGAMYGSIKLYKKYRKMEDIKPVLPNGLGIPEKDISKYAFGGWNPTNKEEKPPSDEMLLLPNSKTTVSSTETKKDDNCAASDHTDSTVLSEISHVPNDRQISVSDDGSDSSLGLEGEVARPDDSNQTAEEDSSNSDYDVVEDPSYIVKNPGGYVQAVFNPATSYVQSAPASFPNPSLQSPTQAASSSYVMATLSPPIFTTGLLPPSIQSHAPLSSGYVRPEDVQVKSMMNLSKVESSPTKLFGPESLPSMPLPPPAKHGGDSSYIQLQTLDSLTSHKQPTGNVPLKPPASNGYVSPGDAVIHKHLSNMVSAGLADEPAILDPAMSPDAYCRFSWSTDPTNDNLHSLLADSNTLKRQN